MLMSKLPAARTLRLSHTKCTKTHAGAATIKQPPLSTNYGKNDSIHHLLEIISETASVLELRQTPLYTPPPLGGGGGV